jgi:hypothetical protein
MRKQDIKPGVVYAYQESRTYGSVKPIAFLAAPSEGRVYTKSFRTPPGERCFTRNDRATTASRTTGGYPAVWVDDPARPPTATLADFEAATANEGDPDAPRFTTVRNLTYITTTWEVAAAELAEQKRADEAARARRAAIRDRADRVVSALRAHGVEANRVPAYGAADPLTLPLDEAEKLIALLAAKNSTEG